MPGTVSEVSATLVASTTRRPAGSGRTAWLEDPVLLGRGQPGVQRQHVQVVLAGQRVGGVPDLPLAAEEDEDVARARRRLQLGHRVQDALHLVPGLALRVVRVGQRPVAHLDRVGAPGHLEDGCPIALLAYVAPQAQNRCGSMVAEVMMTLRSGRRGSSRFR